MTDRTRSAYVSVRVTREELATIRDAAKAAGVTLAQYTRLILLGTPPGEGAEPLGMTANRRYLLDKALDGFRLPKAKT